MTTLILYNGEEVIMTQSGIKTLPKVLLYDVPDGYYVESMNPDTGEPVLKEIPKTEEQQRLSELEAKVAALIGEGE